MKYKIKQITREIKEQKQIDYLFMEYDYAKEHGFNIEDYTTVYEGETDETDINKAVDNLLTKFNLDQPDDFIGHSFNVSDIIELDGKNYYCEGCKKILLRLKKELVTSEHFLLMELE